MVRCYFKREDSVIRQINSGVCVGSGSRAGYYSCCFPWDECLPDGICYSKNATTYYTSLCTDQTLEDSSCQKGCGGEYFTNLSYNASSKSWACCHPGTACSTSVNQTFDAPAPDELKLSTRSIVDFIPTATASSSSSTGTSASAITSGGTSPTSVAKVENSSSSSLSGGAKAGIGVGISIAVLAVVAAVVLLLFRRRRRRSKSSTETSAPMGDTGAALEKDGDPIGNDSTSMPDRPFGELPGNHTASEMDSGKGNHHYPQELNGYHKPQELSA